MLDADITINPGTTGGASANSTYVSLGLPQGDASIRRVAATAATAPETLTVKHSMVTRKGTVKVDRHLVRFDSTFNDTLLGAQTVSAWLVVEVPRGVSAIGSTQYNEVLGRLHAFLALSGVKTKLYNGEY